METLLNDDIRQQVTEYFKQLKEPVQVIYFGKKVDCEYCDDAHQMVEEITALSEKLNLLVYDIDEDQALASQYKVDKAPGIVLAGLDNGQILDYGIRFSGIPSGHEFSSLIHDMILVSGRDSGLSSETKDFLKSLEKPIHLQVFVTPTCPYCPRAVVLAHQMALESHLVEAEMVEAMEFPELSNQMGVSGVPHTTINGEAGAVIGAVPEDHLVEEIQRALVMV